MSETKLGEDEGVVEAKKISKMAPVREGLSKTALGGCNFYIQGDLSVPRNNAQKLLLKYGGTISKEMCKDVTHIITPRGFAPPASQRTKVVHLTEEELTHMIFHGKPGSPAPKCACLEVGEVVKDQRLVLCRECHQPGSSVGLCNACGFECLCGEGVLYNKSYYCKELIGPYCKNCWEDPDSNNCKCDTESSFLTHWQIGDAKWLNGFAE
eukprot:Platyproteum_vivax@DN7241_c0_g1_i7.p1